MPNPCAGVPSNPWCTASSGAASGAVPIKPKAAAKCASGRKLRIHLKRLRHGRIASATVRIGGRHAKRIPAKRLRRARPSVAISLRGLPPGRVRVLVTERVRVGKHMRTVRFKRTYRTCKKRR